MELKEISQTQRQIGVLLYARSRLNNNNMGLGI